MIFAFALATLLDSTDKSPINPDRPDFANSTFTVPVGQSYLEFGYRQTRIGGFTVHDYGDQATYRTGLSKNLEARVNLPSYLSLAGSTGFGDAGLGLKMRFTPEAQRGKPAFGLELDSTFSTGSDAFRGDGTQLMLSGLADIVIDDASTLTGNLVVTRQNDEIGSFTQLGAAASFQRSLGSGVSGFFEGYGFLPQSGRYDRLGYLDAGVMKLLSPNVQVDAYYGHGFNGQRNDSYFGFGVAVRF